MKHFTKISNLFFAFVMIFAFHSSVFAQKDLKVEMITPTASQNIIKNEMFEIKCMVTNNGMMDISPMDTLAVGVQVGGQYVYTAYVQHNGMMAGTSQEVKFDFALSFADDHSNIDFCTGFLLYSNVDPTPNDQFSCQQVNLLLSAPTGISSEKFTAVNVYPNPANDFINIERDNAEAQLLSVYDQQGRLISEITLTSETQFVSLSGYASGIYFYLLKDLNEEVVNRGRFNVVH
jgi:hypothetical protein